MHVDPATARPLLVSPLAAPEGTGPIESQRSRTRAVDDSLGTIFIGIAGMIGAGKSTLGSRPQPSSGQPSRLAQRA